VLIEQYDIIMSKRGNMKINSPKDLDFKPGSSVFLRCDFNVPLDEFGNITDDRRIRMALPTIKYLLDNDCKVTIASHLGRPKGKFDEKYSLKPVAKKTLTSVKTRCDNG